MKHLRVLTLWFSASALAADAPWIIGQTNAIWKEAKPPGGKSGSATAVALKIVGPGHWTSTC